MNLPARLLIFAVLPLFFILFLFQKPVYAQNPASSPEIYNQYAAPETDPDVPPGLHTYSQSLMIEVISAMICQLGGVDPIRKDAKCLGINPETGKIGFVEGGGGAIGAVSSLIAVTLTTPPASSADYVRYMAGKFGISQKAYAAEDCAYVDDPGFCGLTPLREAWVAMRNVAYLFFVVIFIVIGVAIMLRVHIDPRTVMTIENQIPKIIVGIILVTFSFAIAGLLIDLMYVAIYLAGAVLKPLITGVQFGTLANSSDPFQVSGAATDWLALMSSGREAVGELAENILVGHYTKGASPGIVELFLDSVKFLLAVLISLIAWLLIFLALLFTLLRLWVALLVAYISIIIDVIFAPFWLIIGLLPGSSLGAGAWLKDIIANLSVFPATIIMFVLANFFINIPTSGGTIFTPPLVGGELSERAFGQLIALGFIFMTPNVLTLVKQALKAPKVAFGPALEPLGAAGGTVGAAVSAGVAMRTSAFPATPGAPGGLTAVIRKFARAA